MRNTRRALGNGFYWFIAISLPHSCLLAQESPSAIAGAGLKVPPCAVSQAVQAVQYPSHMVSPKYPKQALVSGLEGTVELTALIDRDARTKDLRVVKGDPVLVGPSVKAVRQWRFRPVLVKGESVETTYRVKVRFNLLLQEAISEVEVESPRETVSAPKIASAADPSEGGVYKTGQKGVIAPKPIYSPDPEFSERARKAGEQETAILSLIVDADGRPQEVSVACGSVSDLDEKAIESVKTWRFEPGTKDGRPVAMKMTVQVDFQLYDN
jgi:TonB family protein